MCLFHAPKISYERANKQVSWFFVKKKVKGFKTDLNNFSVKFQVYVDEVDMVKTVLNKHCLSSSKSEYFI